MTTAYVQEGRLLTITAPYTCASGSLVHVNSLVGVAQGAAASADPVVVDLGGVHRLTHAVTNTALPVGTLAYYDTTNRVVSATNTFQKIGVFAEAKVTTTTDCVIRLNGAF
jgi:predicted RecA/RadA family phage recombinase